jgi:hypothetical protein
LLLADARNRLAVFDSALLVTPCPFVTPFLVSVESSMIARRRGPSCSSRVNMSGSLKSKAKRSTVIDGSAIAWSRKPKIRSKASKPSQS